ncbi:type II toxin-antitoxin system Phd/YefM family antitoxin [Cryptosporangium sp. NPDC048952]|uniref:antitoxin VbhA family protein n=1 Tax=Cryptosporangium sp. NPDC048952 TaxID=3363961 RepID=UPI00371F08CC
MRIKTLSVREAREQLSSVLDAFRKGDRTPVGVGSHRKTEAVVVPIEVYDELVAERARRENAIAQADASIRAEGLATSPEADAITDRWKCGEISTAEMRSQTRALFGIA